MAPRKAAICTDGSVFIALTLASTAGGYWRLFCSSTAKKVTVAGGQIAGACYTLFLFVVISKTRLKIEVDLIF